MHLQNRCIQIVSIAFFNWSTFFSWNYFCVFSEHSHEWYLSILRKMDKWKNWKNTSLKFISCGTSSIFANVANQNNLRENVMFSDGIIYILFAAKYVLSLYSLHQFQIYDLFFFRNFLCNWVSWIFMLKRSEFAANIFHVTIDYGNSTPMGLFFSPMVVRVPLICR